MVWMTLAVLLVGAPRPAAGQEDWRTVPDTAKPARLTLEEAVVRALDANRQLDRARAGLAEADGRVTEAWGQLYPAVDLGMTYTRNLSPAVNFLPARIFDPEASADEQIAVQFGADNAWDGFIDVQQALFRPAVFLGVGAASRFEALQDEVVRGRVHEVVTQVRTAYYDLLLAQERGRLTANSLRRVRQTVEETRAMNEAGLASDYDVLRLEVEVANLEPELMRAENAVRRARRQLAVLLDLDSLADADGLTVAGELAAMELDDPAANSEENRAILAFVGRELPPRSEESGLRALVESARERRSDIRQADLTEELRHTEMRVDQTEYLPEISLFGTYQVNASQNGDPTFFGAPRAYSRRVGVQVTLPVFNGFQREARIDQRRAGLREARAQAALTRDEAEREVRDVVDEAYEARARAAAQARAVEQAGRGFEIASAQYREGIGSQLEVTDAEVALRQSAFNYAEAVYDYLVARARLDRATGEVPLAGRAPR